MTIQTPPANKPKSNIKSVALVITIFFICVCCVILRIPSPPKSSIKPTSTRVVIENTHTPIPQNTSTPQSLPAAIPGLQPADVTVNLEERDFTCSEVEQGQIYYTRTCKREEENIVSMIVVIYGSELFTVDLIETTVFQFVNPLTEMAAPLLGFMATMPYTNAVPEDARAWVETELKIYKDLTDVTNDFAGVPYHLYGPLTAITLEMGDLK